MKSHYRVVVIGGGVVGVSSLYHLGKAGWTDCVLLEKNEELAAETSGLFHEWLHTGSLYTLVPDNLKTTKYLLGAIDHT